MCMLFGFNSGKRFQVKAALRSFFEYSYKHPDGWGICTYWDKGLEPGIIKEAVPAYKSYFLKMMLDESIAGKTVLAHIRKKTSGQVSIKNTHPFQKDEWILVHNGTVNIPEDFLNGGQYRASGETDSERILCYIINNLQELQTDPQSMDVIINIEKSIQKLSSWGKLNLILTNGNMMFVHSNVKETLYYAEIAVGAVTFCTKPILGRMDWNEIPNNRVLVYQDGILIYKGKENLVLRRPIINEWANCFN